MKYSLFFYLMFKWKIRKVIDKNYWKEMTDFVMKNLKKEYKKICSKAFNIWKWNPLGYNMQFALLFITPYLISEKKIKPIHIKEMMEKSLDSVSWFFKLFNLNSKRDQKIFTSIIRIYNKRYTEDKEKKYPKSFKIDYEWIPYEGACYYRITRCPICEYAKQLWAIEVMSYLCWLDDLMIKYQHWVLHRKWTISNWDKVCDYYITWDKE